MLLLLIPKVVYLLNELPECTNELTDPKLMEILILLYITISTLETFLQVQMKLSFLLEGSRDGHEYPLTCHGSCDMKRMVDDFNCCHMIGVMFSFFIVAESDFWGLITEMGRFKKKHHNAYFFKNYENG